MNRKKVILTSLSILIIINLAIFGYSIFTYTLIASPSSIDKKVIAFYYPWYGNTTDYSQTIPYPIEDDDSWLHWNYEGRGWYPPVNACSANTPSLGWYDSSDPSIIQTHLEQAEWAGLDAFIISYWGYGGREQKNMQIMMDVAKELNSTVKLAPYFEIFLVAREDRSQSEIISNFTYELSQLHDFLLQQDYRDQVWFENEKPVVWVYATKAISQDAWVATKNNLDAQNKSFFFVADNSRNTAAQNALFHAQHQYDVYGRLRYDVYLDVFHSTKRKSQRFNQIFVAGVTPGYDDTVVRDGNKPMERDDGVTYLRAWNKAISLNPDWISITSWNEWHEGTEIEPSQENGFLALDQTRQFIQEFKTDSYENLIPYSDLYILWIVLDEFYYSIIGLWIIFGVTMIIVKIRIGKK